MAVAFRPNDILGRGDLDIFLTNCNGYPSNAAEITYSIYYVDPGPPETEVLIGSATRTPVNPAVGEYYASLMIPSGATSGDYRIRWAFKELVNSSAAMVVQEFAVVSEASVLTTTTGYSSCVQGLIDTLRILLRDQCVGGEETVELDVGGERMVVRMDDLWETLDGLSPPGQ